MYTCIQSYRSIVGAKRYYNEDEEISDMDHGMLPEHEQAHWKPSSFLDSVLSDSEELPSIGAIANAVEDLFSFNSDSEQQTTAEPEQSNDFGGGDGGGAGASGEF